MLYLSYVTVYPWSFHPCHSTMSSSLIGNCNNQKFASLEKGFFTSLVSKIVSLHYLHAGLFWPTLLRIEMAKRHPLMLRCTLCWQVYSTFHGVMVLLTHQCGSAERLLSLISQSSVFQWYVFFDPVEGSHWVFLLFWRGLLTGCLLFPTPLNFTEVYLLDWEEHAVHVHSFSCSCLYCLEKTNFP